MVMKKLVEKALELKKNGLTEKEIGTELHLSQTTIEWMLGKDFVKEQPKDVKIGWKSIAVFPKRITYVADIMVDIIEEEIENDIDAVVGVAINGVSLASFIGDFLDVEMVVYRPPANSDDKGTFSENFAHIKGKNVVIVDDVINTGETIANAIKDIKHAGATPLLATVIVNKTMRDKIDETRVRGLIRACSVWLIF